MDGTLWLINGAAAGFETAPEGWGDAALRKLVSKDEGPLKVHSPWLIDLVWACRLSDNARVGIVLGGPGEERVRFLRSVAIGREVVKYVHRWEYGLSVGAPVGGYASLRVST